MPNSKNLKSLGDRTTSEQRKIAQKGGKASGKVRREKKTMRECADLLLSLDVKDDETLDMLTDAGVKADGCNNKMLMVFALMRMAQKGDVAAIKEMRNLIGEDKLPDGDTGQTEAMKNLTGAIKESVKDGN